MTDVVFSTASGSVASDLVVVFTIDVEPLSISIRYLPDVGPGSWDVVYGKTDASHANGVIADKFLSRASRSVNTWTILPPVGGWPCRFQVVVDPAGGSGAGFFPAVYGQTAGDLLSDPNTAIYTPVPVSWGALLYIRDTGASLGGFGDFFGCRHPSSGASAYLGNYLMCDGAGGLRMGYTRNSAEDVSPAWVPGAGDVGKLHAVVGTVEGAFAGALIKIYVNGVQVGGSGVVSNPSIITPNTVRFGASITFPQIFPKIGFAGGWRSSDVFDAADCVAWCAKMRARALFQPPDGTVACTWFPPDSTTGPSTAALFGSSLAVPGMFNSYVGASRAVLNLSDLAF